jgi:hypothetical protein
MMLRLSPLITLHAFTQVPRCQTQKHPYTRTLWLRATALPDVPTYDALTADQRSQIDCFIDILLDWNTRMNLTGEFGGGVSA